MDEVCRGDREVNEHASHQKAEGPADHGRSQLQRSHHTFEESNLKKADSRVGQRLKSKEKSRTESRAGRGLEFRIALNSGPCRCESDNETGLCGKFDLDQRTNKETERPPRTGIPELRRTPQPPRRPKWELISSTCARR
ncbi:hypothetical protein EVAR_57438_1 [Eumeta japonica]|uniref:Uncharacterized protein n=1 Tax=Eumeta variegata TaxID=151549 RepID=A0A4C1Y9B6_EUMVA|nr:hypothetical protein EVAR_57438_1 [Eumeta japonica]